MDRVVPERREHGNRYSDILNVLYSMRRTDENHQLLSECLLDIFSKEPDKIHNFIKVIQEELEDPGNENKEKIARRYIYMLSFLCEKFGLYEDKLVLDDLCFKITEPKEYKKLKKSLEKYQKKSEKVIEQVFEIFGETLTLSGMKGDFKGRYKNLFSIHKKCKKKKLKDVLQLSDIFAFRIIVDGDKEDCYKVLNILHNTFTPLPHRFKDYIHIPKINGYQSLHTSITGILTGLDIPMEVQIRTQAMDDIANTGIASHFLYAKDKSSKLITEKERKLISHYEEITEINKQNSFVYCLTPHGDIMRLKKGSSIKDFAYKIHTKLIKKALYGIVNTQKKDLDYIVKNFDTISVITS